MRKLLTPLIISLTVVGLGSVYALVVNLFPDTLDFPRVPTWDGTVGGVLSRMLSVGGGGIENYAGDGTVENSEKLSGFAGTGYLKNRECLNTDVWLSIGASGMPNCGLTGSLLGMNIGTLTGVVGSIVITKPDSSTMAGVDGVELYAGDILSTAGASSGTLAFSDASLIRLDELTIVELTGGTNSSGDTIAQIILSDGNLWGRVLTSTGIGVGGGGYIAGVRGTSISVEKSGTGFIFAIVDSIISDTGAVNITTSTGVAVTQIGSGTIFAYTGGIGHVYRPGKITLLSGSIWRSANTIDDMEYLFRAQSNPADVLTAAAAAVLSAALSGLIISRSQQELLATIPLQDDVSMCEASKAGGCNDVIGGDIPDELKSITGSLTTEQIQSQREVQAKGIICDSKYGGVFWPTIGGCVISPPGKTVIWMADYTDFQDSNLVKQPPMNPTMVNLKENGAGIPPIKGKNFKILAVYEAFSGTMIPDGGRFKPGGMWNTASQAIAEKILDTALLDSVNGTPMYSILFDAYNAPKIFRKIRIPNAGGGKLSLAGFGGWDTYTYPAGIWLRKEILFAEQPNMLAGQGLQINESYKYIAYPLSEIGGTGALLGKAVVIELNNEIPDSFGAPSKGYVLDVGPFEKYYIFKKDFKCDGGTDMGKQYLCKYTGTISQIAEILPGQRILTITGVTNPAHLVIGNYWKPSIPAAHLQAPIMNTIKSVKIVAIHTCTDGIKNQGETYVDCGGPHCGACVPQAGFGDNSSALHCTVGFPVEASNTGCVVGATTWKCSGVQGGATSPQYSITRSSCPIDGVCDNSDAFRCIAGSLDFSTMSGGGCGIGTSTWKCLGTDGGAMSPQCSKPQSRCSCNEWLDINWGPPNTCYYYNPGGTSVTDGDSRTYSDIYAYPYSTNRSMGSLTVKCNNGVFNVTSSSCLTCNDNGVMDNGETGLDCGGGGCEACITCPAEVRPIGAGHSIGPISYTSICMYNLPEQTSKESWEIVTSGNQFSGEVSGYISTKCSSMGTRSTSSPMVPNWASSLGYLPGCYKNPGSTAKDCVGRPDMPYILSGGAYVGSTTGSNCYYE